MCTPPYLLGRLGLLMLGSTALLIPGIIVFAVGITLQASATGAVIVVTWPKVEKGLGFPARAFAILP